MHQCMSREQDIVHLDCSKAFHTALSDEIQAIEKDDGVGADCLQRLVPASTTP